MPGESLDVESDTLCILFDRLTGTIASTHRVITLTGGEAPDQAGIEATARELAVRRGRDVIALDALHVAGHAMDQIGVYTVKVDTRELVFQTLKDAGIDIDLGGTLSGVLGAPVGGILGGGLDPGNIPGGMGGSAGFGS